MPHPDFVIAGAGIVGCALALELERRGASVVLLDRGRALAQTSSAAAGMLAVHDPGNPPGLTPLSSLSAALYPAWLDRLADLSGARVPFQTRSTLELCEQDDPERLDHPRALIPGLAREAPPLRLLAERSVDPRQLADSLRTAIGQSRVDLREESPLERVVGTPEQIEVTSGAATFTATALIDCMGVWSPVPVVPRKGQMLAVAIPAGLDLSCVLRTPAVYLVPRTEGPDAGRVVIGATVEDVGFDRSVKPRDILTLNALAVKLIPGLAGAAFLESWAGLRPATADGLPLLGATRSQPRYVLANGLFRNGILLAPATAHVLAQALLGEQPAVDLQPFSPMRFLGQPGR